MICNRVEGKRSLRRRDNATFADNPHTAPPTSIDIELSLQLPLPTFPHPLPPSLPRTLLLPPTTPPPTLSSPAGLFSFSLRGARRTLRARPSSPFLVLAIESHLVSWLKGGTYLNPDHARGHLHFPGIPIPGRDDIREVGRDAGMLVWAVKPPDGGFERYVVHCVARWYGVVSFSKDTDGHRLIYLLRPNITLPDPRVNTMDTPPATDASDVYVSDAGLSDLNSTDGSDYNSDMESVPGDLPTSAHPLSDIDESRPSSPASWSVLGSPEFAIDSEDHTSGFAASMESLSLSTHGDTPDPLVTTLEEQDENTTPSRAGAHRDRLHRFYPRSASSPSPARRSPRRPRKLGSRKRKSTNEKKALAGAIGTDKGSFYDYLFA